MAHANVDIMCKNGFWAYNSIFVGFVGEGGCSQSPIVWLGGQVLKGKGREFGMRIK